MSEVTDLERRIADLEGQIKISRLESPGFLVKALPWLLLIVSLSANAWFISASFYRDRHLSKQESFWLLSQVGSTASERKAAFLHLVREGNEEWQSARLNELDLTGADFAGVRLNRADLNRVNFRNASLERAQLFQCSLHLADLTGATLTEANLGEADLLRGTANGADMRAIVFRRGRLEQSNLLKVDLSFGDLEEANLLMADLTGSRLLSANLRNSNLVSTNFTDTELDDVDFEQATIVDSNFTNSNWWRGKGLTTEQLEFLIAKYPPNESASDELKDDFAKWLSEYQGE